LNPNPAFTDEQWRAAFFEKIRVVDDCWLWTGHTTRDGYGVVKRDRRDVRANRAAYELLVGSIPAGLTLDHLCRRRACVNPAHLEPVPIGENLRRGLSPSSLNARKTHCPKGHPYDAANTCVSDRRRRCLACNREACRAYYERRRARQAA
jgi:hypothetical protein